MNQWTNPEKARQAEKKAGRTYEIDLSSLGIQSIGLVPVVETRRRSLSLVMEDAGNLVIRVPRRTPVEEVEAFAISKKKWIASVSEKMSQREEEVRSRALEAFGGKLPKKRELKKLARKDLTKRLEKWNSDIGTEAAKVRIGLPKSRFGSCSSTGTISLNMALMLTPEWVRDYVVIHELCHLHHMDHSARFWAEVRQFCPRAEEARRYLRTYGSAVISLARSCQ